MVVVTLIYVDGTRWLAGGFPTMEAAQAWINEEKTRPYWKQDTQVEVIDNTPPPEQVP